MFRKETRKLERTEDLHERQKDTTTMPKLPATRQDLLHGKGKSERFHFRGRLLSPVTIKQTTFLNSFVLGFFSSPTVPFNSVHRQATRGWQRRWELLASKRSTWSFQPTSSEDEVREKGEKRDFSCWWKQEHARPATKRPWPLAAASRTHIHFIIISSTRFYHWALPACTMGEHIYLTNKCCYPSKSSQGQGAKRAIARGRWILHTTHGHKFLKQYLVYL